MEWSKNNCQRNAYCFFLFRTCSYRLFAPATPVTQRDESLAFLCLKTIYPLQHANNFSRAVAMIATLTASKYRGNSECVYNTSYPYVIVAFAIGQSAT